MNEVERTEGEHNVMVPQEKLWVDFDKEVSMRQPSS